jgi:hypothetical protein
MVVAGLVPSKNIVPKRLPGNGSSKIRLSHVRCVHPLLCFFVLFLLLLMFLISERPAAPVNGGQETAAPCHLLLLMLLL